MPIVDDNTDPAAVKNLLMEALTAALVHIETTAESAAAACALLEAHYEQHLQGRNLAYDNLQVTYDAVTDTINISFDCYLPPV